MFKINMETGAITTFQGDSGSFYLCGERLNNYDRVTFTVYNNKNKEVMHVDKDYISLDENNGLLFNIAPTDSDKLTVKTGEDLTEYYYSIKLSKKGITSDIEHTFLIGNNSIDDKVPFIVYAKRNEGY